MMNKGNDQICLRMNDFQKNKQNVAPLHTSEKEVLMQNNIDPWVYGTPFKKTMTCDGCRYTCERKNTLCMHKQRKHKTAKEQEDEGSLMKYDLPKHVNLTVLSASLQEELIGLFQSDAKEKTTLTNLEDLHLHNNLAKPSDIQFRDVVKLKEDVDMDTEALLMEEDDIKTSVDDNETLQELIKVKLNSNADSVRIKCGKYVYQYNKINAQELARALKEQNSNVGDKHNVGTKVDEEDDFEFSDEDYDIGKESLLTNNIVNTLSTGGVGENYKENGERNFFNNSKIPGTKISKIMKESLAIIDNVDTLLNENTKVSFDNKKGGKFNYLGKLKNTEDNDMIAKSKPGNFKSDVMGGKLNQQSQCFETHKLKDTLTNLPKIETESKLSELKELERKQVVKAIKKEMKIKIQTENTLRKLMNEKKIRELKLKANHKEEKRLQLKNLASQLKTGESRSNVKVIAELRRKVHFTIKQRMSTVMTIPPPVVHADYEAFDEDILDEMINEMIHKNESLYTCTVCGKATSGKSLGKRQNLRDHVEARHVVGVSHNCQICGAEAKTRNSQRMHMRSYHKKISQRKCSYLK